jgi:hypothetical protein
MLFGILGALMLLGLSLSGIQLLRRRGR